LSFGSTTLAPPGRRRGRGSSGAPRGRLPAAAVATEAGGDVGRWRAAVDVGLHGAAGFPVDVGKNYETGYLDIYNVNPGLINP